MTGHPLLRHSRRGLLLAAAAALGLALLMPAGPATLPAPTHTGA